MTSRSRATEDRSIMSATISKISAGNVGNGANVICEKDRVSIGTVFDRGVDAGCPFVLMELRLIVK